MMVDTARPFTTITAAEYERRILEKLSDWRSVLRQEASEARTILRQVLVNRLDLRPTEVNGERLYAYRGEFTIGGLFEGTIRPQALASPTGFEPVFWP